MQAEFEDLEKLLAIQKVDLAIMQAKKKRAELPQRIKVQLLRKKRDEISAKLDQALDIEKQVKSDYVAVEDEDRQLAEKQQRAQEIIDTAGSDYRKVESQSKEMASIAKRRETLGMRMAEIQEKLDKVVGIRSQLENAIAASQSEESRIRASFEAEDKELMEQVKALNATREDLVASVPANLVSLYDSTAKKTKGVAIGVLEEGRCGVCRGAIEGGRLIELRASAPLGRCPNCKRLLVVE